MVRKAMKEGIKVEVDNQAVGFLIDTHKANMKAIGGKPKSQKFFELLPSYYKSGIDFNIYVAKYNNETIAALLLFYFNDTVEYYTPVIIEKYRDKQSLSLIIYEAMIDASKKSYKLWNWGGTWATQGGVYTFKKRWGTRDVNYYYHIQINNEHLLKVSKQNLLNHYEDFFVIPFDKLKNNNG